MVADVRYVALGDSYTIGTSVGADEGFPSQLAAAVEGLELVANLGVNGYATADLIRDELPAFADLDPGFATLLVGANDAVRDVPLERYETNLTTILDALLSRLPERRIIVVTVPDYTVMPHGAEYGDPAIRSAAIRVHNAAMSRLATARGLVVVDIHDLSLDAAHDPSLVAEDGLHPSGAQYARWVERLAPVVRTALTG